MPLPLNLSRKKIILASQSPRRKQLLEAMGIAFTVEVRPIVEDYPENLQIDLIAEFIAQKKAAAFENDLKEQTLVLTGDTVVCTANAVLGKPQTVTEAQDMLQALSGKSHKVISAVCLLSSEKKIVRSDVTTVYFRALTTAEIDHYIKSYKPFDKAGSYGIQEWLGHVAISRIEGSYNTVMGLPTHLLYEMLAAFSE